ncbi:hypothetical protein SUGI_0735020 [Cryptomeria japonica]|nr:hypothetical protein SUGI_0735020 [Cryptomeria japonica]
MAGQEISQIFNVYLCGARLTWEPNIGCPLILVFMVCSFNHLSSVVGKGSHPGWDGDSDHARSRYEDVALTHKAREVALRLCAWVEFSEKSDWVEFSEKSVKEVMTSMGKSCSDKFIEEHKKIVGQTFLDAKDSISTGISEDEEFSKVILFQEFASQGDTSDAIWNFLWYFSSSYVLGHMVNLSLSLLFKEWFKEECQTRNRRDFIMFTAILSLLSEIQWRELLRIVKQACDDRQITSLAYNDKTGNYDILNKILILAVRDEFSVVVNKVLEWGAQPQANLGPDQQNMALYYAILYDNKEIVRSLFDKCHSKEQFANAANEKGMTALHWACESGSEVSICRMIVECGGKTNVRDNRDRLPLHYAVERGDEGIVDVLIGEGDSDTVQS